VLFFSDLFNDVNILAVNSQINLSKNCVNVSMEIRRQIRVL
jgi:hypothetical protein